MRRASNLLFTLLLTLATAGCDATIGSDDEVGGDTGDDTGTSDDGVPLCSNDDDCGEGQVCIEQFCSTPVVTDCLPGALTMDGCSSNAICLDLDPESEGQACYTMPPCAADHTCPIGVYGALCNTDYIPDKDEICLIGVCDTVANCPADWFCVREQENDPIGFCSGGGLGEPCTNASHCLSGMCFIPIPGLPGFCQ
jgi:hypothetical protein